MRYLAGHRFNPRRYLIAVAQVVHRIPGRVRIKVGPWAGDRDQLAVLECRLGALPAVTSIRCNAVAGSIVVEYDGVFDEFRRQAREAGARIAATGERRGAKASTPPNAPAAISPTLVRVTRSRVYRVLRESHGRTAIENLVHALAAWRTARDPWLAALLACGAAAQIARGDVLSSVLAIAFHAIDAAHRRVEFA